MPDQILIDDFGRGRHALQRLREAAADHLCDVSTSGAEDDFHHRATVIPFDGALLIDGWTGAYLNERTPRHIARGGLDHYMVTLCMEGALTFESGRRSQTMRPGDICLIDMAQASRAVIGADDRSGRSRTVTLTIPRAVLAPLLATPDGVNAALLPRNSTTNRLLATQYLALCGEAAAEDPDTPPIGLATLAAAIADAVGGASSADAAIDRASRELLLAAIKRRIIADLRTDRVDIAQLCREYKISRATLYRLFEPEGGLWRYMQDQRLQRAFAKLAGSAATAPARMADLALEFGFSSDSTFVRAFRRRFGLTPGEVRQLADGRRNGMTSGIPDSVIRIKTLADQ